MKKVMIEVYLPAALRTWDVMIPSDMQIHQVSMLVAQALSQGSGSEYSSKNTPVLCDRRTGAILDINMSAWEAGLRNGTQLMLI